MLLPITFKIGLSSSPNQARGLPALRKRGRDSLPPVTSSFKPSAVSLEKVTPQPVLSTCRLGVRPSTAQLLGEV